MNESFYVPKISKDQSGKSFTTVSGDVHNVRIYTLSNGLQVFLAQNFDAPRIQTYIALRSGSNNDPSNNTGLAHYLEHMMFKGTSKIGTTDWEKEGPLLEKISDLFEKHAQENDPEIKKAIYREIDSLSQEASKYAISNEYDACLSSIGATGTNAHTWHDETVYKNNIPKNELEKWLMIEKERFTDLTLRLFHTELETVYEEFNRGQDNDARLVNEKMMSLLFPTHPLGQQTTIGKPEHLKNPSMKAIHQYYDTYYVPNNYCMVLVGDLEFEPTIALIEKYFGQIEAKAIPEKSFPKEKPIEVIQKAIVKSPSTPRFHLAWRIEGNGTREVLVADIFLSLLSNNGDAGLLDLNINYKQKALYSSAYGMAMNQYGFVSIVGVPKANQSFDDLQSLIFTEIDKVRKGEFTQETLKSIVNDFKLQRLKGLESADGLAKNLYETYLKHQTWQEELNELNVYDSITREELIEFANTIIRDDNYVLVAKLQGESEDLVRVENPGITPIALNRQDKSEFLEHLESIKIEAIQAEFINFEKELIKKEIKGREVYLMQNPLNEVSRIFLIFPFGSDHEKELMLSLGMMEYLGSTEFSLAEIKETFYRLGVNYNFNFQDDQFIISFTGLEESIFQGAEFFIQWMENIEADNEVINETVQTILENRLAIKKDKNRIIEATRNYAKYGPNSRYRDVLPEERLRTWTKERVEEDVRKLGNYPFSLFYYGSNPDGFLGSISPIIKEVTISVAEDKKYDESSTEGEMFFATYDMVQVELSKVGRSSKTATSDFGKINVFNEYFGSGLSSVVFQEIRESKSLAYSAYASYLVGKTLDHYSYVVSSLGTQPDKLLVASETMDHLLDNFPKYPKQFEIAKESALKKIATQRFRRMGVFWQYLRLKKQGLDYTIRESMYKEIQNLTLEDLEAFFNREIRNLRFNSALIGSPEILNDPKLERLGEVRELSLEELFNF